MAAQQWWRWRSNGGGQKPLLSTIELDPTLFLSNKLIFYLTSQVVKLNLTKINVATVLLLLILLQYINITDFFSSRSVKFVCVKIFVFLYKIHLFLSSFEKIYPTIFIYFIQYKMVLEKTLLHFIGWLPKFG
jgi:hypothetical protein